MKIRICFGVAPLVLALAGMTGVASGATTFFGPTAYLSSADVPLGFYTGAPAPLLEDFEDQAISFGVIESTLVGSSVASFSVGGISTDSVELGGVSRFVLGPTGPMGLLYTFSAAVRAAGIVWTDTFAPSTGQTVTFEAFGPGMVSLGTIVGTGLGDGFSAGDTFPRKAEDRFFGATNEAGIIAISIAQNGGSSMEVDHLQFQVPEPSRLLLAAMGCVVGLLRRRRPAG